MTCRCKTPLIAGTSQGTISSEAGSKDQNVQRLTVESSDSKRGASQTCRLCGTEKPIDEFYFRKDSGKYRLECKECFIELVKYREYGVCRVKYDEMLVQQRGKCGICGTTMNSTRYNKLAIDHDHKTGKVRGLLCGNCNSGLGMFKDSPIRLKAAITYLERHQVNEDIV